MSSFYRMALLAVWSVLGASLVQAQEIPVYRWYHPGNDWHLYTASSGERPSGWSPEAVVFRVYPAGTSGTTALYRLQRSDGGHFYTVEGPELNATRNQGWQVEGTLGYVATQPRVGALALHRFLKGNGRHFYTTNRAEGEAAGFRYEGVIGYVPDGDDAAARERLAAEERQRAEAEARRRQAEEEARRQAEAASRTFDVAITTSNGMCLIPSADRPLAGVFVRLCAEGGAMYRIENGYVVTAEGNCLTPAAGWSAQRTIQLVRCRADRDDGTSQQWYFHANKLVQNAAHGNLCMDVQGGARQAGARVIAFGCRDYQTPAENQRFTLGGSFPLGLWALAQMPAAAQQAVQSERGAVLFSNGTWVIAAGGNNVIASGGNNVIASGGNNVIAPGGNNLRVVPDPALLIQGASVIASGGNNVIASGALNLIGQAGGNVIAPGGGNVVLPHP